MRGEQFLVDARLAVKAFEKGGRGQLDQVLEAGAVLGQQRQVVAGLFIRVGLLVHAGCPARCRLRSRGSG